MCFIVFILSSVQTFCYPISISCISFSVRPTVRASASRRPDGAGWRPRRTDRPFVRRPPAGPMGPGGGRAGPSNRSCDRSFVKMITRFYAVDQTIIYISVHMWLLNSDSIYRNNNKNNNIAYIEILPSSTHFSDSSTSEEILRTRSSDGSTEVSLYHCDSKHFLARACSDKYLVPQLWSILYNSHLSFKIKWNRQ